MNQIIIESKEIEMKGEVVIVELVQEQRKFRAYGGKVEHTIYRIRSRFKNKEMINHKFRKKFAKNAKNEINYLSKDKINWKDQVVCPKCDNIGIKAMKGYYQCKKCNHKIFAEAVTDEKEKKE